MWINFKVCITGLFVDGEQILVGKNSDQTFFTLDSDGLQCSTKRMKTKSITIQDAKVIKSECIKEEG